MSANGISTLTYKRDRQLAKLAQAAGNRAATGRRATLDITQLPTVYGIDNNSAGAIVDNPNVGGLVPGRPWIE
jgi:hypothetical protein